jgi:hypothetical protein
MKEIIIKSTRHESADNKNKHAAIINYQIKKRHGVEEQET